MGHVHSHSKVMRARIILLADAGLATVDIAHKLDIGVHAVEKWKRRFRRHRMACLRSKGLPGHLDRRASVEQKTRKLIALVHERPKDFGINRSSWTLSALSRAFHMRHGETVSITTISDLISRSGYKYKRAKCVLTSPDPDYREKVELLLKTLRGLEENDFFFFIDEMGPLRIKKYGGRGLVRRGDSLTFPQIQGQKGSITMSAALSATKNQVTWLFSHAKDTRAMIDLIEILYCQHYCGRKVYITWDAASWHRSTELLDRLDQFNLENQQRSSGPTIHLVPLPRSSQFLDVLEAVFSGLKRAVIHHSDYKSKAEMKTAISQHFVARNEHFRLNPKRAGKKIWEIDFFEDLENVKSGNYREW